MEDYVIFGHPVGNQVIWVGLSMKRNIKNVLKFRELLVTKVNAKDSPIRALRQSHVSFSSQLIGSSVNVVAIMKIIIILSNQLNFQTT